jgi:hypothetical protein
MTFARICRTWSPFSGTLPCSMNSKKNSSLKGQPEVDLRAEALDDLRRHRGDVVDGLRVGPAALVVDPHRVVPVVERDERLDALGLHRVGHARVVGQALRREHARLGLDPRPVDRDPVRVGAQAGGEADACR